VRAHQATCVLDGSLAEFPSEIPRGDRTRSLQSTAGDAARLFEDGDRATSGADK
jgi:hypothetical protein